jgi:thymidine kinase
LFEGSKRLLEVADVLEEIKNVCVNCDRKAIINAKFYTKEGGDRVILTDGPRELDLGAEEKYQPMCWNCFST